MYVNAVVYEMCCVEEPCHIILEILCVCMLVIGVGSCCKVYDRLTG